MSIIQFEMVHTKKFDPDPYIEFLNAIRDLLYLGYSSRALDLIQAFCKMDLGKLNQTWPKNFWAELDELFECATR